MANKKQSVPKLARERRKATKRAIKEETMKESSSRDQATLRQILLKQDFPRSQVEAMISSMTSEDISAMVEKYYDSQT